ncbi:MAG: AIR synthase related protein [Promethearchaeota archaeon]
MLKKIANCIRTNKNILEKIEINPIVQFINLQSFKSSRIFSDIGEDSAAVKTDNNKYILLTTDRIKTSYVEKFPYGAGFSSILVSVDDIYACGGTPIAASLIISVKNVATCKAILEGICEASKKFHVPIIRGHTNPHGMCFELSSTMIGEIKKDNYISASNAKVNDNIILVVDFDGKISKASNLYWDTVTFKSSEEILKKRKSMNVIAEKHLATASKDISNGGIFGTLLQLIKYSNVGANINIENITIPPTLKNLNYSLEKYSKMYLTTSFILTASNENCKSLINIFKKYELKAEIIGKILKEKILRINNGKESIDVIKY